MPGIDCGRTFFDGNAALLPLAQHDDARGVLLPFEFGDMPFEPRRTFVVRGTTAGTVRGEHSHRSGTQLLICLEGRIEVLLRSRNEEMSVQLQPSAEGLLIGPGIWSRQTYLEAGSLLLVFASERYDPLSYDDKGS